MTDFTDYEYIRITVSPALAKLFGDEAEDLVLIHGAITTPKRFENFSVSLAHLFTNGSIYRFGEIIGKAEDITLQREH